jgi:hypothetical protein
MIFQVFGLIFNIAGSIALAIDTSVRTQGLETGGVRLDRDPKYDKFPWRILAKAEYAGLIIGFFLQFLGIFIR